VERTRPQWGGATRTEVGAREEEEEERSLIKDLKEEEEEEEERLYLHLERTMVTVMTSTVAHTMPICWGWSTTAGAAAAPATRGFSAHMDLLATTAVAVAGVGDGQGAADGGDGNLH
jgi:hypothetical protein